MVCLLMKLQVKLWVLSVAASALRQPTLPGSVPSSEADLHTLRRQLGQVAPAQAALGIPNECQCRHGYPQAFAMDPMPSTGRMNSGMIKLTCPLLVRAIDTLEDEGEIARLNENVDRDENWQERVKMAHQAHASARSNLLDEAMRDLLRIRLGDDGADSFVSAGVAASSIDSLDLKCLHAWLGDYLFRGNESLGCEVAEILRTRGVDITGTEGCKAYCDPSNSSSPSPPKPRNKQRLRSRKEIARRKRRKQKEDDTL